MSTFAKSYASLSRLPTPTPSTPTTTTKKFLSPESTPTADIATYDNVRANITILFITFHVTMILKKNT